MRYTTVIDVSEIREVYRNHTARLVYLHMTLKAGYHDADRDIVRLSIRRLAEDVGVTVSAVRHALKLLEKEQLIRRSGDCWIVKKWVEEQTISARAKTKREMQEQIIQLERQKTAAVQELASQEKRDYDPEAAMNSEGFKRVMQRFGLDKKKK